MACLQDHLYRNCFGSFCTGFLSWCQTLFWISLWRGQWSSLEYNSEMLFLVDAWIVGLPYARNALMGITLFFLMQVYGLRLLGPRGLQPFHLYRFCWVCNGNRSFFFITTCWIFFCFSCMVLLLQNIKICKKWRVFKCPTLGKKALMTILDPRPNPVNVEEFFFFGGK